MLKAEVQVEGGGEKNPQTSLYHYIFHPGAFTPGIEKHFDSSEFNCPRPQRNPKPLIYNFP